LNEQTKGGCLKVLQKLTLPARQRKFWPTNGEHGVPATWDRKPDDRAILLEYKATFGVCAKRLAHVALDGCRQGVSTFNHATRYQLT